MKGLGAGLREMMRKVEGRDGDCHEAWRWVKKSLGEYQAIRKKGLQWKEAYDRLRSGSRQAAVERTFSSCSDLDSEGDSPTSK